MHFRIVTLNSNFVPVNDKVGIALGRGKRKVGQTEREQGKEDSFQGCEEVGPFEMQNAGGN